MLFALQSSSVVEKRWIGAMGPEYLVVHDFRVVSHVGQDRRGKKNPGRWAAAAGHDFGAFAGRILDEGDHVVLGALVDQRAEIRPRLESGTDSHRLHRFRKPSGEGVRYAVLNVWNRLAAVQASPPLRILAIMAPATASSRSASSKTMKGALPPNSIEQLTIVLAASRNNTLPTRVEPVNDSLRTRGSLFHGHRRGWRWRKGVEDRYHYRFWGQVWPDGLPAEHGQGRDDAA